jgi:NAD(P)-dependent dehydrogenase (short-subunit alcohol dehydrogenase family)
MSERLGWRQGISDKLRARQVEALVRRTVEEWGGLDAMVNNAGLDVTASTPETTEVDCERVNKRSTGCRSNRSTISSIRWCAYNWE